MNVRKTAAAPFLLFILICIISAHSTNHEITSFDKQFDDFINKVGADLKIDTGIAIGVVAEGPGLQKAVRIRGRRAEIAD